MKEAEPNPTNMQARKAAGEASLDIFSASFELPTRAQTTWSVQLGPTPGPAAAAVLNLHQKSDCQPSSASVSHHSSHLRQDETTRPKHGRSARPAECLLQQSGKSFITAERHEFVS